MLNTIQLQDLDDWELVERWNAGHTPAGNVLVLRYFNQVHVFFVNSVAPRHREDLIQETFTRLTTGVKKFEGRSSFRTFLFRIARFTLYDHLRKQYKGKLDFDPLTHSVLDHGHSPSHFVTEIESHQRLLACLQALPVDLQKLIELYFWQNLTAQQVAEVLELSLSQVKYLLARTRRQLRESFEDTAAPISDAKLGEEMRKIGTFLRTGRILPAVKS